MAKARGIPLLFGLIAGSLLVGVHQAVFYWRDLESASALSHYWPFLFSILLALWIDEDSRGRSNVYRPFDYRFLIYFTSIFYAPYYLWRTRGLRGAVASVGLVALPFLGTLLAMVIYVAR
jgi:hypothetical protein